MLNDYSEDANDALELLQEFGQTMQLVRSDGGTFNPATSAISGASDTSGDFSGVKVNIETDRGMFDQARRDGLVFSDTALILAEAVNVPFAPQTNDRVVFGGETHEIWGMKEVNPAGTPVLYKLGIIRK